MEVFSANGWLNFRLRNRIKFHLRKTALGHKALLRRIVKRVEAARLLSFSKQPPRKSTVWSVHPMESKITAMVQGQPFRASGFSLVERS